MHHTTAQDLTRALVLAKVDAFPIEELNLWCVRIRVGGRNWCNVIGNDDELTWGPTWEFHTKHHGDIMLAVKQIKKTLPRQRLAHHEEKA